MKVYAEHKAEQRDKLVWAKTELNFGMVRRFFHAMKQRK
jgi:hypothetical protein